MGQLTLVSNADLVAFLTIFATIFVVELTDKDALLLLALATKTKPKTVFAAGSITFVITTAIIVVIGSLLIRFIPILWIKLVGGIIMLVYATWEIRELVGEKSNTDEERALSKRLRTGARAFLGIMFALAALDLAGDATELLLIVFVARFGNALLVFVAASTSLVAATALETTLGNRLGKILSAKRVHLVSIGIFMLVGAYIIITSLLSTAI